MAKMKVIDCFRLRSRPSAPWVPVALRIPSATHPEPLNRDPALKENAAFFHPDRSGYPLTFSLSRGKAVPEARRAEDKERPLTVFYQIGLIRRSRPYLGGFLACAASTIAGRGSQILVGCRGNALTY